MRRIEHTRREGGVKRRGEEEEEKIKEKRTR